MEADQAPTQASLAPTSRNHQSKEDRRNGRMASQVWWDTIYPIFAFMCIFTCMASAVNDYWFDSTEVSDMLSLNAPRLYYPVAYVWSLMIVAIVGNFHLPYIMLNVHYGKLLSEESDRQPLYRSGNFVLFGKMFGPWIMLIACRYALQEDAVAAIAHAICFAIYRILVGLYDYRWYGRKTRNMQACALARGAMGISFAMCISVRLLTDNSAVFLSTMVIFLLLWVGSKILFIYEASEDIWCWWIYIASYVFAFVGHLLNAIWLLHGFSNSCGNLALAMLICYGVSAAMLLCNIFRCWKTNRDSSDGQRINL